jgi:hypothetical protein
MAATFFVMAAIAGILSAVRYQIVYHSMVDSFPLQFQDDLTSRYAFPVLVLNPSTPLSLQAEGVVGFVRVLSLCFARLLLLTEYLPSVASSWLDSSGPSLGQENPGRPTRRTPIGQ